MALLIKKKRKRISDDHVYHHLKHSLLSLSKQPLAHWKNLFKSILSMDNLKGSSHQWQILGKLGTALFEIHNRLSRNSTTTVVVYIKKGKKISDDHVCHHFTHSSLSLSKLSALCGHLHIGKIYSQNFY